MTSQTASSKLPPSSVFSFTAPFPLPSSTLINTQASKQQRRVSLALPSSPRLFPAWSFRDDTSVGVTANNGSPEQEKRGKMRGVESEDSQSGQIASTSASTIIQTQPQPEKKQRKKWSEDETQMLVKGCNKVCVPIVSVCATPNIRYSGVSGIGKLFSMTPNLYLTIVPLSTLRTGALPHIIVSLSVLNFLQIPYIFPRCLPPTLSERQNPSIIQNPLVFAGRYLNLRKDPFQETASVY